MPTQATVRGTLFVCSSGAPHAPPFAASPPITSRFPLRFSFLAEMHAVSCLSTR